MSRQSRLDELKDPQHGPQGSASWKPNLDYFSERASANSKLAPRASGPVLGGPQGTHGKDAPKLPSTGGKVALRDTAAKPKVAHRLDRLFAGTDPADKNNVGSSFMKSVRRSKA
jgi:hypothetical protein